MKAKRVATVFGFSVMAAIATIMGHVTAAHAESCVWGTGWMRWLCGLVD